MRCSRHFGRDGLEHVREVVGRYEGDVIQGEVEISVGTIMRESGFFKSSSGAGGIFDALIKTHGVI